MIDDFEEILDTVASLMTGLVLFFTFPFWLPIYWLIKWNKQREEERIDVELSAKFFKK